MACCVEIKLFSANKFDSNLLKPSIWLIAKPIGVLIKINVTQVRIPILTTHGVNRTFGLIFFSVVLFSQQFVGIIKCYSGFFRNGFIIDKLSFFHKYISPFTNCFSFNCCLPLASFDFVVPTGSSSNKLISLIEKP